MAQRNEREDLAVKTALKTKLHNDKFKFTTLRNKVVQGLRKADFFLNIISEARGNAKIICLSPMESSRVLGRRLL